MYARLKTMFQFLAGINAAALAPAYVIAALEGSLSWSQLVLIALTSLSIPICLGGARLAQQERDRQAAMPWAEIMQAYGQTVPRR